MLVCVVCVSVHVLCVCVCVCLACMCVSVYVHMSAYVHQTSVPAASCPLLLSAFIGFLIKNVIIPYMSHKVKGSAASWENVIEHLRGAS